MGFFKRNNKPKTSKQGTSENKTGSNKIKWTSNATSHWPDVHCQSLDENDNPGMNTIIFGAALNRALGDGGPVELKAFSRTYLSQEGVLEVPILVEDHGKKVPVFYYPDPHEKAAAHFTAVSEFFNRRGMEAVYFSTGELPAPTGRVNPFEEFWAGHLEKKEGFEPAEGYAVWFPSRDNPRFTGSPASEYLDRAYKALDGIESYVLASILRHSGYFGEEEKASRAALPGEMAFFPMEAPEEVTLIFSASREKGLRFAFPRSISLEYRDCFLRNFAEYCEKWKEQVIEHGYPRDNYEDDTGYGKPFEWWNMFLGVARQQEEQGTEFMEIGKIFG